MSLAVYQEDEDMCVPHTNSQHSMSGCARALETHVTYDCAMSCILRRKSLVLTLTVFLGRYGGAIVDRAE
ncbi:unnamed protein product [Nippostrongylus brasiliensis]|uniref:Uncharacterized protein n=1 Tax=Nippostrongylus brasiliensis TaxID=27835 RepID=A0A0N4XY21_NIPBR|nr:unnamed protein product [Nippostrongylus brasiliensis]